MKAAQWLKVQVLFSIDEWQRILKALPNLLFFPTGMVVPPDTPSYSHQEMVERYRTYLIHLQQGSTPPRAAFSLLATVNPNTVSRHTLSTTQELIQARLPTIQVQEHALYFDSQAHQLRSMLYSSHAIPWGLQFSYPHIIEDSHTRHITRVDDQFENTVTFSVLRQWIRQHTLPLRATVQGHISRLPVRIGKECLPWIQTCPAVQSLGMTLAYA